VLVVRSFEELDAQQRSRQRTDCSLQRAVYQLHRDGAVPRQRAVARRGTRRRRGAGSFGRPGWNCGCHTLARFATPTAPRKFQPPRLPPRTPIFSNVCRNAARHREYGCGWTRSFSPTPDSFNVVGELRGRERPGEVVVVGGHIDSWDVGTGSTDDGGRVHRDVGSPPHHEEVEPASAANGARRPVDQRGEWHTRSKRVS
jgi:hypothetical protein